MSSTKCETHTEENQVITVVNNEYIVDAFATPARPDCLAMDAGAQPATVKKLER